MTNPIVVSAPGSLMLLGEHAVLEGHPCLIAAIDKRVKVSIAPRNDGLVTVQSTLGSYEGDRDDLPDHPSFRFVAGALNAMPDALPGGLDMVIEADMPPTIGFGTSAAVTAAVLGALQVATRGNWSMPRTLETACRVIRGVQGRGSGADAAASVYGGIVYYRMCLTGIDVVAAEPLPLTALYCGYKTPTPEVIARVDEAWRGRREQLNELYRRISNTVERGRIALHERDHRAFGAVLSDGQARMNELGVDTPELEQCRARLMSAGGVTGAKISGSGLGDCVVGWGRAGTIDDRFERHDLKVSPGGIRIE